MAVSSCELEECYVELNTGSRAEQAAAESRVQDGFSRCFSDLIFDKAAHHGIFHQISGDMITTTSSYSKAKKGVYL